VVRAAGRERLRVCQDSFRGRFSDRASRDYEGAREGNFAVEFMEMGSGAGMG
jgi:hypothetical protein